MSSKSISIFKKLEVPPQLVNSLFLLIVILLLAPYIGGVDFGVVKVPVLPNKIEEVLKWISPIVLLLFISMFLPIIGARDEQTASTVANSLGKESKYILQSTPDIILNEVQKQGLNTDGLNIIYGFNINDLIKRLGILNGNVAELKLIESVKNARELAFTSKYAEPKEDEKLVDICDLHIPNINSWESYLIEFLSQLDINNCQALKVLDVGIGNAAASYSFLKTLDNLIGVDVSAQALEYAKRKLPNAKLIIGSAEALDEIDSFSVDLYVSFRVYQSTLFDIKQSLHEAYRVLTKGGGIVISIPIMFMTKNNNGVVNGTLKGLIPPGSNKPCMAYANQISERICWYLELLGFKQYMVNLDSPFEIFIGARK